jgi:hypothetical protein
LLLSAAPVRLFFVVADVPSDAEGTMNEELEVVYACVQSRREQGAPCAFAVVAVGDYASTQRMIAEHGVEPIAYDSGLCVWEFLNLASAARLRDDLLALDPTRCPLVQLIWIDGDPYRSVGPSRGVSPANGVTVANGSQRRTARLFDEHWQAECEHCGAVSPC